MRPTKAEISVSSLKHNFDQAKRIAGHGVSVLSVVKADAYGHGAIPVSRALLASGSDMLGVATVDEALELRGSGIGAPIVLLGGIFPEEASAVVENDLTPALFSLEAARSLDSCGKKAKRRAGFHLKIDTGMNRLGINPDELPGFLDAIQGMESIRMEGVFSHLANADLGDRDTTAGQLSRFKIAMSAVSGAGLTPTYYHLANSAALQLFPETVLNMVRPGIMLYGASGMANSELLPVMKLKTKIIQMKRVPTGSPISYGGTFITKRPSIIAVLPVGYADGYMRSLSNNAWVSVRGKRVGVLGTVCMDLTIVDVTDVPDVGVGDDVVLFGDGVVGIDEVAGWAGTIPYELLSNIGKRVPRVYV